MKFYQKWNKKPKLRNMKAGGFVRNRIRLELEVETGFQNCLPEKEAAAYLPGNLRRQPRGKWYCTALSCREQGQDSPVTHNENRKPLFIMGKMNSYTRKKMKS